MNKKIEEEVKEYTTLKAKMIARSAKYIKFKEELKLGGNREVDEGNL